MILKKMLIQMINESKDPDFWSGVNNAHTVGMWLDSWANKIRKEIK